MSLHLPEREPRILFYDIETTPILQWRWTAGRDDSRALRVDEGSYILTVAYAWEGYKTIHTLKAIGGREDYGVVVDLWQLFDHADIVVAHNGDKFDRKKANIQFFKYGLHPPSPYATVDTLKVARKHFAHHSHSLDALAKLKLNHQKKQTGGMSLWFDVMEGDEAAMKRMLAYNKADVEALRELYYELQPWIDNHPNRGLWNEGVTTCPKCGSTDLQKRGVKRTNSARYQQYYCNTCGGYSRSRYREAGEKYPLA